MVGNKGMSESLKLSRRRFIRNAALGSAFVAGGWPLRASWALPRSNAGSLRFVYFTDVHARTEWGTPDALAMAAESINNQKADLVICGGDMITDGFQSSHEVVAPRWKVYLEMHKAIHPTPICAIGNHDLVGVEPGDGSAPSDDPRNDVRSHLGLEQTYRSFDVNGYHFIILDGIQVTRDPYKYHGRIDDAQITWLTNDLQSVDPESPIILVSHMPLLTSFFQAVDGVNAQVPPNRGLVNNREVLELFAGRRLPLVLQGHLHVNEMIRWKDTTFITGGAVCGKWWRGEWHGTSEGFGVIELHDNRVDWQYMTYGWNARRPPGM